MAWEVIDLAEKKLGDKLADMCKNIENGMLKTYDKAENKIFGDILAKDNETVEDAKKRLSAEQKEWNSNLKKEAVKLGSKIQSKLSKK